MQVEKYSVSFVAVMAVSWESSLAGNMLSNSEYEWEVRRWDVRRTVSAESLERLCWNLSYGTMIMDKISEGLPPTLENVTPELGHVRPWEVSSQA